MSITSAKSYARNARNAADTDEKLDYLAKAIEELAKVVGNIEYEVGQIKRATR